MAEKKKKIEQDTNREKFSKLAFLEAFQNSRDFLSALLDEDTLYTQEEVETLLNAYKSKEVM